MSMPFNEIVWIVMTSIVKGPLKRKYGKEAAKQYIKKAKPICKQMFLDIDDIGKDNLMNITSRAYASNRWRNMRLLVRW